MVVLDDPVDLLETSKETPILQLAEPRHDEKSKGAEKPGDEEGGESGEDEKSIED